MVRNKGGDAPVSHFFAVVSRMKFINRWGLMRNTRPENLSEHSLEVAMLAHALAVIHNRQGGDRVDPEHAAFLGMYHDTPEIFTGDLPTPVKYYNEQIVGAYKEVEQAAQEKLLSYLPEEMREAYAPVFERREEDAFCFVLLKAADKLSALIKCIEEEKSGNREFGKAKTTLWQALCDMNLPEVEYFCEHFLPSYSLTLDEQE